MSDFPVIGIVGLQAAGKTEVASKLVDLGASRVRMGHVVWREVEKLGLEVTEKNVANIANELREEEGMGAIAKHCVPLINEKGAESKAVVVDGIRGIAEVEVFREEFEEDFSLLSVEASEDVRYKRIKSRKREDDIDDFKSFRDKDIRELNWGLEEAMESADYQIVNEGSLEKLKKRTIEIFEEITGNYEV